MKKKLQKEALSACSTALATTAVDLKTVIHDHALFFDKLVELIPAKFYLPVDEDSKPWFQGLSKGKKASLKQQTRENIKKSRRDRLDPEKSQTTTLDLLKKSISKNANEDKDSDDDDEEEEIEIKLKPVSEFDGETSNSHKSVTYEELQQRLHHKLEMLRANRGQGKRTMIMNEVRKRDNYTDKKRKREDKDSGSNNKDASGSGKGKGKIEADFEFGKVKLGDEDGNRKKAKKASKVKELEKAKKLHEAKKENVVVAKKHSWKAATEKAMGVKVHDDPKLLKRSLQKEKKRREKSAGKWKDRVETQEKMKEEKQAKRRGNIEERANQKKARKIAKREKKLMRPGFEGRKEGYIGEKSG
ncbi:putative ribosomal RNA-processing protein [Helianthus annuus]|nr:putative ribosomal RNA-processing protein [Helianthus annuus]KAJ0807310.1 putative ribosomal RNA-processing protein [Helianthus annuus]